jgi:hypothetical protein
MEARQQSNMASSHLTPGPTCCCPLQLSCYRRRPIVLRQLASLASLPPALAALDLFVHHVVAPGPAEQLLALRNRLARLESLRVTSYRVHHGLLLPASCLPEGLKQLRCDGAVVVQLPAAAAPGTPAVAEAELVPERVTAGASGAAGAGKARQSSRDAAHSSSSSSSSRGKAAAGGAGQAGQDAAARQAGSSRAAVAAGPRSRLSKSSSKAKQSGPARAAAAAAAAAAMPAAGPVVVVSPKLYSRLVQLYYSPLEAVQLAGLPLLRELTLCMDLHVQAQELPLSYHRCLPNARPPAADSSHAPGRRRRDSSDSGSSSEDDTEPLDDASQRPAAVVDTSRRTVRILSLPSGLQQLRVISERPAAAVQQRVVASGALVPGSLAALESLEISCPGDFEALLLAASQLQEVKVSCWHHRHRSSRDAAVSSNCTRRRWCMW